jgi:transposase
VCQDISDDEIVGLYVDGGLSAAEIAEQLGCSASLVYARLARRGVPRRDRGAAHRKRPGDPELAHLYGEGALSLGDLARRYGVSAQVVRLWLIGGGIERRPRGAPPAAGHEDPVPLYVAGWSAPAIAERLGGSPSTIYRRLDVAGVARRTVKPIVSRNELIEALEAGMAAPAIAARLGVSVSCVCRGLAREQLMTRTQAARQARRHRQPELYADGPTATNVSVSGNAQRYFALAFPRGPDQTARRAGRRGARPLRSTVSLQRTVVSRGRRLQLRECGGASDDGRLVPALVCVDRHRGFGVVVGA